MHNKLIRLVIVSIGISLVSILISPPDTALAKTNCREIARDTQKELVLSVNEKQLKTVEEVTQNAIEVFITSQNAYPECRPELEILWDWNRSKDTNELFPFPKSDDPKTYALGPVSWWWDTIYNGLLGGSTLLMIFFWLGIILDAVPFDYWFCRRCSYCTFCFSQRFFTVTKTKKVTGVITSNVAKFV